MMEEEMNDLNLKIKQNADPVVNSLKHADKHHFDLSEDEDKSYNINNNNNRFSTSLSDLDSTILNESLLDLNLKKNKKNRFLNYYSSDDDQKEIEIENLNKIVSLLEFL